LAGVYRERMPAPAGDIRVITFNCAAGNPQITTAQRDLLALPFYREVLEGDPRAAILALQEVGPEQARALKAAAARGPFELVQIRRPGQGNALLVPERYALLAERSRYFLASALRPLVRRERLDVRQLLELRMWSCARLADRDPAGLELTVFNTHLSGDGPLRVAQARSLLRRVHRARAGGPVILAGDLNVRATGGPAADGAVRALFAPLRDMAPAAVDARRPAIDWILAAGFEPAGARLYTGDSLSLPGSPSAELVSDHYAKEALLRPA
jgi:endonuclease/exonuclease/phosphatase family metal-dependent hydrolase